MKMEEYHSMMHVLEVGRPAKSECVKFSLSLSLSLSLSPMISSLSTGFGYYHHTSECVGICVIIFLSVLAQATRKL
jgi:hypothetical protein